MVVAIRIILFFSLFALSACAPTPPVAIKPAVPELPGHPAFRNAERAFESQQYAQALDGYNTFLRDAYNDRFVDTALFNIGKIYYLTGRGEDAKAVFARLIHEFPQSARVSEAMLEILKIMFGNGEYEAVIKNGTVFSENLRPSDRRTPFYIIIADAYAASGTNLEAARFYYRAWEAASDEDKETAWTLLKLSVEQLGTDEIQALVAQVTDKRAMGFMLYRLGMAYIIEEKYDDAVDVLNAFMEGFPDHPDAMDASNMILSLTERARFTPLTIGCVLPLSGSYALFGQRALDGIELALSRMDQTRGALPFRILVKDSRSDPGMSEIAVDELDQEKVAVILGPMAASEAAAVRAQAKGIPIFVFTQREGVTDIGPYVFRNFITPQMQVQSLVSYALDTLRINRFAILYPDENYGRRYMNLFWDQVAEQGRVVVGVEAYDPEGTDFAKPIKKLAGIFYKPPQELIQASLPNPISLPISIVADNFVSNRRGISDPVEALSGIPLDRNAIDSLGRRNVDREDEWHPIVDFDAVFIPDAPKKAGLVIPQLAYYDIRDVYLLGTNLWNSKTLLEMSGDYMQNTLITDGFFAESQMEKTKDFVTVFQETYNRIPGIIEASAYDSTMMVIQTMRQTATDSRRDLKQALLQIQAFDGVCGRISFAPNGEAQKTLQMLRIQQGRFVEVQRTTPQQAVNQRQ